MDNRNYLLKVLGLSAIPRIVTFALKMISFPLMVRSLGASEYGIIVYIMSVIAVLESFVDFGVSSAAGKDLAVIRETSTISLDFMIKRWAKLQFIVAISGLIPLLLATYFIAMYYSNIKFSLNVMILLVFATWSTIFINFTRACFNSILAFRAVAILDVTDSIMRSIGWLWIAYYMPTTFGYAIANLFASVFISLFGVFILLFIISKYKKSIRSSEIPENISVKYMLDESLTFLWLRLITRLFHAVPIIIFGRLFSSELVGIIGAFSKIVELFNFPFAVIGNALAVRAPGVVAKGYAASRALWDAAARFISISIIISISVYIGSEFLAEILFGNSRQDTVRLISILSATVFTTIASSIIAPMSDYVGALKSRNYLLTLLTVIQGPIIYLGGVFFDSIGSLAAYVTILFFMNIGYAIISIKHFFKSSHYVIRFEIIYLNFIVLLSALFIYYIDTLFKTYGLSNCTNINIVFIEILIFWLIIGLFIISNKNIKKYLFTRNFFEYS